MKSLHDVMQHSMHAYKAKTPMHLQPLELKLKKEIINIHTPMKCYVLLKML